MPKAKLKKRATKTSARAPYQLRTKKGDKGLVDTDQSSAAMQLVLALRRLFTAHTSTHPKCSEDATAMAQYMRNKFSFFGIKTPERRKIQGEFVRAHKAELEDRQLLVELMPLLWGQEEREFQYVGCDLLRQYRESILGTSEADYRGAVACLEELVTTKSWWDTVDAVSYPVVGYFVQQRPDLGVPLMQRWIEHDNMWLRRVAILHQNCLKEKTDQDRLFRFCLARSHESEFFIRKAIGWALRDYSRTAREAVRGFVEQNRDKLSSLSIKEALKHC